MKYIDFVGGNIIKDRIFATDKNNKNNTAMIQKISNSNKSFTYLFNNKVVKKNSKKEYYYAVICKSAIICFSSSYENARKQHVNYINSHKKELDDSLLAYEFFNGQCEKANESARVYKMLYKNNKEEIIRALKYDIELEKEAIANAMIVKIEE